MKAKQFNIEEYEKKILEDFEREKLVSVDNLDEEMCLAKEAAHNFMKRDKSR